MAIAAVKFSSRSKKARSAAVVPGQPPMRWDAPARQPGARGALPPLHSDMLKEAALRALDDDVYAASSMPAVSSRRISIQKCLVLWHVQPEPITYRKVRLLAATLKAGRYRSHDCVLSQYKVDAERRGDPIDTQILRGIADANRACARGLGPAVQAMALPFIELGSLPGGGTPWSNGGPVGPRNSLVTSAWWLMREVEISTLRASLVTITAGRILTATLTLPASKSDPAALGVKRTHACICRGSEYRKLCPVHALWDQALLLRREFPRAFIGDVPQKDFPMFPSAAGKVVCKEAMDGDHQARGRAAEHPLRER